MNKEKLQSVAALLGVGITILASGVLANTTKFSDQYMSKAHYNELKDAIIEKQETAQYVTPDEWAVLVEVYDKELKEDKKEFDNFNTKNTIQEFNNRFKTQK